MDRIIVVDRQARQGQNGRHVRLTHLFAWLFAIAVTLCVSLSCTREVYDGESVSRDVQVGIPLTPAQAVLLNGVARDVVADVFLNDEPVGTALKGDILGDQAGQTGIRAAGERAKAAARKQADAETGLTYAIRLSLPPDLHPDAEYSVTYRLRSVTNPAVSYLEARTTLQVAAPGQGGSGITTGEVQVVLADSDNDGMSNLMEVATAAAATVIAAASDETGTTSLNFSDALTMATDAARQPTTGEVQSAFQSLGEKLEQDVATSGSPSTTSLPVQAVDLTPPETSISNNFLLKRPKVLAGQSLTFALRCTEDPCAFQCAIDNRQWSSCSSPLTEKFTEGFHTVRARSVDAAGNTDPTPDALTFQVVNALSPSDLLFPGEKVEMQVSSQGGLVTADAGNVTLVFPAGAAASDFTLTVQKVDTATTAVTPGFYGSVYDFGPEGTQFKAHVEMILAYAQSDIPKDVQESQLALGTESGGRWEAVTGTSVAEGMNQAKGYVMHFSRFSVIKDTVPPPAPKAPVIIVAMNPPAKDDTLGGSTGAAEGLARVRVYKDGLLTSMIGAAIAKLDGSFDPFGIGDNGADTSNKIYVVAVDNAGNQSAVTTMTNDITAPDTAIGSQPAALSNTASATLTFTSPDSAAAFQCSIDSAGFSSCVSPVSLSVADGSHTFRARAVDPAGNTDATPASFTWTADTGPPETTITTQPPAFNGSTSASFNFSSPDPGATFECALDGASFSPCVSPLTLSSLPAGSRAFKVRAKDPAGNPDPTPAQASWTVDLTGPTAPGNLAATPNGSNISVTFTPSTDAGAGLAPSPYVVHYDSDASGPPYGFSTAPTNLLSITLSGLASGTYYVTVTADDAVSNRSAFAPEVRVYLQPNASDGAGHFDGTAMNYSRTNANDAPYPYAFSSPIDTALDTVNHRLFEADSGNHRVLVFNLSTANDFTGVDREADYVLGQPDFKSNAWATTPTQSGMWNPSGLAFDSVNNRLFVADYNNFRVLVFNTATITNGMNAANVLGQTGFTSRNCSLSQSGMCQPWRLAFDSAGNRLFVSMPTYNRVMVFNTATITNGMNASNILGQATFGGAGLATTQSGMYSPRGLAHDSTNNRLFVADQENNRVLVFSTTTITDGMNASNVLGQVNFVTNNFFLNQSGMWKPYGVTYDSANNRLFMSDWNNNRVLVFGTTTITDGMNASNVLGQADFTTRGGAYTQNRLVSPDGGAYDAGNNRFFLADPSANRVTVFNGAAIADGMNASDGLGHLDGGAMNFTRYSANDVAYPWAMSSPFGLALDGVNRKLFAADNTNHRILVFNLSATNDFAGADRTADNVLGNTNFKAGWAGVGGQAFVYNPSGVALDASNNRLFVADTTNNRVLVFSTTTITNGMNASNVLGQANFSSTTVATTQSGMSAPTSVAYDSANNRLFVADSANHRVLVFGASSITNGMNAVNVLGQPDFTTATIATTRNGMYTPYALAYDSANNRLFVADSDNHRVLVFNTAAITDGMNAANVIGQENFVIGPAATTPTGMSLPRGLAFDADGNRLFVADRNNNRVLVFNTAAVTDGMAAANEIGQTSFYTYTSAAGQSRMNQPVGLTYDPANKRLFVSDSLNHRILLFNVP